MPGITDHDRAILREAGTSFCDALRHEGEDIVNGVSGDAETPHELAEALRAVARIGIMSLQHRMDFNDPDFPTFFRTMDDRYKYGGPDAHITYLTATVRGGATYRLRANHHHREFNINVSAPVAVKVDQGDTRQALGVRELWSQEMQIEPDGSFDVLLSDEQQPGNWLHLDQSFVGGAKLPDQYPMAAGGLMLRTYYWDPDDGLPQGHFCIERIDERAPLTPAQFMAEPMRIVEGIYRKFDLTLSAEAEAAMREWIATNPQGRFGKHRYTPDGLRLDTELVRGRFADYIERFRLDT